MKSSWCVDGACLADTKAGASPETPLQSFFKPPTPPPTTTSPSTGSAPQTTTPTTSAPSTSLMCDQCNAGPFANALALAGHKTGAHAKKAGKRVKKPGVGFSLFSASCIGFSGIPSLVISPCIGLSGIPSLVSASCIGFSGIPSLVFSLLHWIVRHS